jgi:hypothetical protein
MFVRVRLLGQDSVDNVGLAHLLAQGHVTRDAPIVDELGETRHVYLGQRYELDGAGRPALVARPAHLSREPHGLRIEAAHPRALEPWSGHRG